MILYDLSFIRDNVYAGVAKYAYRILDYIVMSHNEDKYTLVVNIASEAFIKEKYPQFKTITIGNKYVSKIPILWFFFYAIEFKCVVSRTKAKVVFAPWANVVTCLKNDAYTISVIHDLQNLIDMKGFWRFYNRMMFNTIIRNSNKIVTISDFSKHQIISYYPNAKDKVINLGNSVVMTEDNLPARIIEKRYILFVGRICPMKNVVTLVKAFSLLKNEIGDRVLVIVGKKNTYWDEVLSPLTKKLGISELMHIVENCDERELSALYRDADLFVFPSLREGFGFPPIEAAYMLTPVITSKCDSLEEVTLGILNTYENPLDEIELADKIKYVLANYPTPEQLSRVKDIFKKNYSLDIVCRRITDFIQPSIKK